MGTMTTCMGARCGGNTSPLSSEWVMIRAPIRRADSYDEFKQKIEEGGFVLAHWDGTTETEEKIKEETKATIRCIPFESFVPGDKEPGKCMVTGKPSACRVIFARSY